MQSDERGARKRLGLGGERELLHGPHDGLRLPPALGHCVRLPVYPDGRVVLDFDALRTAEHVATYVHLYTEEDGTRVFRHVR